jgi:hypothetical protein
MAIFAKKWQFFLKYGNFCQKEEHFQFRSSILFIMKWSLHCFSIKIPNCSPQNLIKIVQNGEHHHGLCIGTCWLLPSRPMVLVDCTWISPGRILDSRLSKQNLILGVPSSVETITLKMDKEYTAFICRLSNYRQPNCDILIKLLTFLWHCHQVMLALLFYNIEPNRQPIVGIWRQPMQNWLG